MASKHSAGILLFRRGGGEEVEFLLVHPGGPFWRRKDAGAWSIPKGQIEHGEEPRACALRELGEELGPAPELDPETLIELGSVRQRAGQGGRGLGGRGATSTRRRCDSNTFEMEWPPRSGSEQRVPRGRPRRVVRPGDGAGEDPRRPRPS